MREEPLRSFPLMHLHTHIHVSILMPQPSAIPSFPYLLYFVKSFYLILSHFNQNLFTLFFFNIFSRTCVQLTKRSFITLIQSVNNLQTDFPKVLSTSIIIFSIIFHSNNNFIQMYHSQYRSFLQSPSYFIILLSFHNN